MLTELAYTLQEYAKELIEFTSVCEVGLVQKCSSQRIGTDKDSVCITIDEN